MEAQRAAAQKRYLAGIGNRVDNVIENAFLYSTSDMTLNAINQVEQQAPAPAKKKKQAVVVCDAKLTEEELNEYVKVEFDEEVKKNKKKGNKGPELKKVISDDFNNADDDDMADFRFHDEPPKIDAEGFPVYNPLLYNCEAAPKKEDDSRSI